MRLWVAENVLQDWTSGIAFIHAKDENDAVEQFLKDDSFHFWCIMNTPDCECHKDIKMDLSEKWVKYHKPTRLPDEFKEVVEACAYAISGGG